MGNML
ncbi:hypothetical protein Patl1_00533 [Pistacia atlantica]